MVGGRERERDSESGRDRRRWGEQVKERERETKGGRARERGREAERKIERFRLVDIFDKIFYKRQWICEHLAVTNQLVCVFFHKWSFDQEN